MNSATSWRSPVASTMRSMPSAAARAAGLRSGAQFVGQHQARQRAAVDRHRDRERAGRPLVRQRDSRASAILPATKRRPPTTTARPSTRPSTPSPGVSTTSVGQRSVKPLPRASATMVCAMMCLDAWSSEAASRNNSSAATPSAARSTRCAPGPSVSVPVLSITSDRTCASISSALPPLIRMPSLAARERPDDDRDRHRQDERTGRRHDEHRHRADRIAGQRPGGAGQCRRSRRGRRARNGRPGATSAHASAAPPRPGGRCRHRCSRRAPRCRQIEGLADIGRAAHDRLADGLRCTGSDSPVSADWSSTPTPSATVPSTGTTSPRRISSRSPGRIRSSCHLLQPPVAVADGGARHPRQQRGHLAPARLLGEGFRGTGRRHTSGPRWMPRAPPRRHSAAVIESAATMSSPTSPCRRAGHNLDEERDSTGSVAAAQIARPVTETARRAARPPSGRPARPAS